MRCPWVRNARAGEQDRRCELVVGCEEGRSRVEHNSAVLLEARQNPEPRLNAVECRQHLDAPEDEIDLRRVRRFARGRDRPRRTAFPERAAQCEIRLRRIADDERRSRRRSNNLPAILELVPERDAHAASQRAGAKAAPSRAEELAKSLCH